MTEAFPRLPQVSDSNWQAVLASVSTGDELDGTVLGTQPFGMFVDVGLAAVGLIEITPPPSPDAARLPLDRQLWPKVGDRIRTRVISFRRSRQIDLEWLP